jgi:uncharacterized membrane protein
VALLSLSLEFHGLSKRAAAASDQQQLSFIKVNLRTQLTPFATSTNLCSSFLLYILVAYIHIIVRA